MSALTRLRTLVAAVADPEIPVVTIEDLGILRDVRIDGSGRVEVDITPTYSGCPAMDAIRADVEQVVSAAGHPDVTVRLVLAPAWSTDRITAAGAAKLATYGIAPPAHAAGASSVALSVRCPQCGSLDTRETSRFGSTACKALWVCGSCREPFDSFKVL